MRTYLFILTLFFVTCVNAQEKESQFSLSSELLGTSNGEIPFWLRTNKFGAIPVSGISGAIRGTALKKVDGDADVDWGYGVDGQIVAGGKSKLILIEAYVKGKYKSFEMKIGRSKDMLGLCDSTLSSGAFAISGNALGIPKAEISIPHYTTLPFFNNLFAVKGSFSYGIIGDEPISQRSYTFSDKAFTQLHQKSFYIQIGRPESKLKLSGGFNHNVQWGDERNFFTNWGLSGFETTLKALTGGTYKQSKVGNHGGSIDQQVEYHFDGFSLAGYHQFFYEVGGLAHLNNIKDGLFGLVIKNDAFRNETWDGQATFFRWNKFLIEIFASKSQGGELDAPASPSGDEDYYNNYLYLNGWRYKSENLGNNFITNKKYIRKELPSQPHESHGNNRLYLIHFGADVNVGEINVISKLSFSRNFGTYATSPIGNATGGKREVFPGPYFSPVNQFSGFVQVTKSLDRTFKVGAVLSADSGGLLYNSIGGGITLTKYW